MGISLSLLDNLAENALLIFGHASVFISATLIANVVGLWGMTKWLGKNYKLASNVPVTIDKLMMIKESLTLLGVVLVGFIIGGLISFDKALIDSLGEYSLMLLLGFIGVQLRNSGIAMREILLNKAGMAIALIVIITSWIGGAGVCFLIDIPLSQAMAISSGFGWYSLSGILISDGIDPVSGGVAFINDLLRELLAILLIPLLIKRKPHTAVGIAGATAMDFTLPIIQKTGGSEVVPMAIISGFILTLASPIFILFFISI